MLRSIYLGLCPNFACVFYFLLDFECVEGQIAKPSHVYQSKSHALLLLSSSSDKEILTKGWIVQYTLSMV